MIDQVTTFVTIKIKAKTVNRGPPRGRGPWARAQCARWGRRPWRGARAYNRGLGLDDKVIEIEKRLKSLSENLKNVKKLISYLVH